MEGLKRAKIRFEGRREIFRQPMVTTIKSGIRIRSDQASSSSHFDDSWQRFTTKSAYTGNGDVEPRTGVSFRIQGSVKMQNLQRFYDCTIGNGQPFRPTPSANKRESFVDRFDDHWNISVSWKTINARGRRATIGALRSKNSGIQACLILVSLKGQACLGEQCAGAVCRRTEKWKKGSSILETQEVYVERCTQLDRQRISSGKQSRFEPSWLVVFYSPNTSACRWNFNNVFRINIHSETEYYSIIIVANYDQYE